MSGRGQRPEEPRPITPPDPTLATRPVPPTRSYIARSFGPAATSDIQRTARSMTELEAEADPATHPQAPENYYPSVDETRKLLKEVENWAFVEDDPTWGYYVFVTTYSDSAREKLPQALANWVKVAQKCLSIGTLPIYSDEAFRRFKFNVVEDRDALDGASVDRVREEFRAQIRGLHLGEGDNEDDDPGTSGFMPPARNQACFLLDEAAITMLADIGSLPDDAVRFYRTYNHKTVTVVDGFWDRSRQDPRETYRGVGQLAVAGIFIPLMAERDVSS
ncbi:hypothetical protein P168DRAFT_34932 [Aspergillus campestris IBT 28561]|uniref:Uncharacterized protein n=1 Tax=Aspergillus campestris (strain IBT 28561) TaxID=1392248 RepID=A0A2I1DHJ5_ASPC2|nr:uncharacterized protein P168DRAFT_34932 [Aspergillus campestris IBT 28561]PKY09341.1 hypothetical protein P168DRAFT_34932 [Aspergillus campestris IBT 28561]